MSLILKPPTYHFKPVPETVGLIQGKEPDSVEEWRVANALQRFEIPFIYQFEIFDASIRGGIVLDFLVLTRPLSTPLEVYGKYWHRGERSSEERLRDVIVEDYFRGKSQPLLILFASDLQTQEITDSKVRRELLA
jgi:hypothetical protein